MNGTCESCGRDGEELFPVHRMYVTPGSWESAESSRTLADVEHWCYSCCTQYPHEDAG